MCSYEWYCNTSVIIQYDGLSEHMPPKASVLKRIEFSPNGHSQVWESENTMGFP